jgi:hypothetical protein
MAGAGAGAGAALARRRNKNKTYLAWANVVAQTECDAMAGQRRGKNGGLRQTAISHSAAVADGGPAGRLRLGPFDPADGSEPDADL